MRENSEGFRVVLDDETPKFKLLFFIFRVSDKITDIFITVSRWLVTKLIEEHVRYEEEKEDTV